MRRAAEGWRPLPVRPGRRGGPRPCGLRASPFEVVPGITSAFAAPAAAGVPVTQRGMSASVTVVTGHRRFGDEDETDWEALARVGGTIVVLMGVAERGAIASRLIAGGLRRRDAGDRGALRHAARAAGRAHDARRAGRRSTIEAPAAIVIGAVAGLDLSDVADLAATACPQDGLTARAYGWPVTEPVVDWATDYDIFDPDYVRDPAPVWDELRGECPVAHTERWGGSWMPTRYEDVVAIAHDVDRFSSREITVAPRGYSVDSAAADIKAPPISSDPPEHLWARRLILPGFSPKSVAKYEPYTRDLCRSLIDGFVVARPRRRRRGICAADPGAGHRADAGHRRVDVRSVHDMGARRARARAARSRCCARSRATS